MSLCKEGCGKKRISGCSSASQVSGVKHAASSQAHSVFSQSGKVGFNVASDCGGTKTDMVKKIKSPVRARVFTNSSYSARSVNPLLARGNKTKILKRMATFHTNSRLVQGECNPAETKIASLDKQKPCIDKGVRQSNSGYNASTRCNPVGVKSIQGKEGGGSNVVVASQPQTIAIQNVSGESDTPNECGVENSEQALLYDTNGLDDDKFVNTIFNKGLNQVARRQAELSCVNYQLWKQQSKFDFGFVPFVILYQFQIMRV